LALEFSIIVLDTVDSTNNYAANLLKESDVADGTVVMAQFQTAGRGQRGSNWQSDRGENLLMSLILKPAKLDAARQFMLSQVICLGLVNFLQEDLKLAATIKWPNDILVNQQKLAGVLIENAVRGGFIESCIGGIGLNVNQTDFEPETGATSLQLLLDEKFDCRQLRDQLLPHIRKQYALLDHPAILEEQYLNQLFGFNEMWQYRMNGETFPARITGLGPHGELLLVRENGEKLSCGFKEIELLRKSS